MPFKLRLKKSRQYNVVSKNVFVISVELLDKSVMECTLSSDSTGQDCLDNVCQRISLCQSEFFGLRFLSKRYGLRWVDMEKPLKRQLEKYASEFILYLAVMYYVTNVVQLFDEVARYQYFLQLKMDVILGNLLCDPDQAVLLAGYSLQAEFGNHDPTRHTTEYLKDFPLLPKHLCTEVIDFLPQVILAHSNLAGLGPAAAEIHYIQKAQQLEGYGVEHFIAKNEAGEEVQLGISVSGISTKVFSIRGCQTFKWSNIINLSNHKRQLVVEVDAAKSPISQFMMEDSDVTKYVWKLCVQQHKFYMKTLSCLSGAAPNDATDADNSNWRSLSMPNLPSYATQNPIFEVVNGGTVSNCNTDSKFTESMVLSSERISELAYDEEDLPAVNFCGSVSSMYTAEGSAVAVGGNFVAGHSGSMCSRLEMQPPLVTSQSNLRLSSNSTQQLHSSNELRVLLPVYRPAPDYETAIQQKYGLRRVPSHPTVACRLREQAEVPHAYENVIGNFRRVNFVQQQQPGGRWPCVSLPHTLLPAKSYAHYSNFVDLSHLGDDVGQELYAGGFGADELTLYANGLVAAPPVHTYSTPELTSQGILHDAAYDQLTQNFHFLHQFKPPPPYPFSQRSSSSTPDLASSQGVGVATADCHPNALGQSSERRTNPASSGEANYPLESVSSHGHVQAPLMQQSEPRVAAASFDSRHGNIVIHRGPFDRLATDGGVRSRSNSTQSAPAAVKLASDNVDASSREQLVEAQVRHALTNLQLNSFEGDPHRTASVLEETNGVLPDSLRHPKEEDPLILNKDSRCHLLENKLMEGSVFMEFERIPKKRPNADYFTATLPENGARNRFKDVLPYEDNRVRLASTKDNKTGYINASHVSVSVGQQQQRLYIAAQGPLASTAAAFWQMVWEQNSLVVIMLTEVKEQGKDKCFPYWPQEESTFNRLQFGDFQVVRRFTNASTSFVTSALMLTNLPLKRHRNVWHIRYTDWPDHGCPEDVQGFLSFMDEIDSVRRHAASEVPPGRNRNFPVVVHCSAGVGRSGVTMLCDVMIHCLDHNQNVDVPRVLSDLRHQRMLTVQTLAQYKFVYCVLIQYLKNSRLI